MTILVWGVAAVAIGHWLGGLDWVGAAFLFLPAYGLASGVVNNEGRRIAKNALVLLTLSLSLTLVPAIVRLALGQMPETIVADRAVKTALTIMASAALWAVVSVVIEIPVRVIGEWTIPGRAHKAVVRVLMGFASAMTMIAFVSLVGCIDKSLCRIPMPVKAVMVLVAVTLFVLSLRRMLSGKMEPAQLLKGSSSSATGSKLRLAERPTTTFADVAGMQAVKDQIRLRLLEPVRNAARARKYGLKVGGGMLLYGPPGTGKTLLARAVAGELGLPFYVITPSDVFGKYVGESERNIRRIFDDIRKNPLSVVFIDELETLFPNRSNDVHETTRKVISVLLQELDGIDKGKNPMLLLGATNVPWLVDEAFLRPGRFDVKAFVGLPDAEARRGILIREFARGSVPHESGLTAYMANATTNYSGADLNGVMSRLRQMAYDQHATMYTRQLADEAIALTSPTANGETLDKIRDWEAENCPENASNSGSAGVRLSVMPKVTLADVAGMDSVKEQIRLRLIEPVQHHTLADMYGLKAGGGVLLYGPPGTGKTFLARAVAGELKLPFYCITAADVFGRYVGDSERNVRRLFRDIRKNPLSVVFIDELEAIFPKRSSVTDDSTRKVISVLLQELDGLDQDKSPVLLLGATNVPWMVDEAFLRPGRFDIKVFVGLPDVDARRQMFITRLYACKIPHETGLTGFLAQRTEGYTGADINGICERIKQLGYVRKVKSFDFLLAGEVLQASKPTSSEDILRQIREWEARQS